MISGHIRTRSTVNGKNTYQVIIELGTDSGGNRKRQSKSGFTTKKAAEKYLAEVIAGVRDIDEVHEKKKAAKVKDWMSDWLDTYLPNIAETTRRGYKEKIKEYIIPEFGDLMLTQIDKKRVQTWVNKLSEKGLSPKTIKEAYGCLKRSFEKAADLDYIKSNPADKTVLPKPRQHTLNCLDTANGKDLLEKVKDTLLFLPVLLALTLGLRRGEMLALKWDDFDFTKGVVHIHNNRVCGTSSVITKAPKSTAGLRDIPISGTVRDLFLTEKEKYDTEKHRIGFKDNGNVIHNPDGTPLHPDTLSHRWKSFAEENGYKGIRLHDLRHSFATINLENGTDMKTLQLLMGHADYAVTANVYSHVTHKMQESAADNINKALF